MSNGNIFGLIGAALFKPGEDPPYHLLHTGCPTLLEFDDGRKVVGNYYGFSEHEINLSSVREIYANRGPGIFDDWALCVSNLKSTKGLRTKSTSLINQSKKEAFRAFNRIPDRALVSVGYKCTEDPGADGYKYTEILGFKGEFDRDSFDLAHSVSGSGEYDTWFESWYNPDAVVDSEDRALMLEDVVLVSELETFDPLELINKN